MYICRKSRVCVCGRDSARLTLEHSWEKIWKVVKMYISVNSKTSFLQIEQPYQPKTTCSVDFRRFGNICQLVGLMKK